MGNHTFIIPAYKDSPFIEECIVSLKNQTRKSNILIVTSTPSPYLQQVAERYAVEIIANNSADKGIAGDWNFGLAQAETRFVTLAHQDDIYECDYLERVMQKATKKNTQIVFTDYAEWLDGRLRPRSRNLKVKKFLLFPFIIKSRISGVFFKRLPFLFGNPLCCPSVTYNMEALPGFAFSPDYSYSLDWHAWLELSKKKGAFVFINKKLTKHRIHQGSETSAQLATDLRKNEELKILQHLWGACFGRFISRIYLGGHKDNII
ncbi:MAG TPA: glycosyltransferase family A protein [Bacteroidales bacterium]|nr:glycosyltransferase family A protein [Bacteroidales bacterium]